MHSDWRSKNGQLKIGLASDHGGFEKKNQLLELVTQLGYEAVDFGPFAQDPADDYPDFANPLCQNLMRGRLDCGILICRSGIGMSIFANKIVRVRAANVTIPEFAELARAHNDANVLCLSGRFVDIETNKKIVDTFLSTEFEGGRHAKRLAKLLPLERTGA